MSLQLTYSRSSDLLDSEEYLGVPAIDSSATVRRSMMSDQSARDAQRAAWSRENAEFLADYNARVQRGGMMFHHLRRF